MTGFERRDGNWHVSGLRDPLAADPRDLLEGKLEPARVVGHWESFQALHPAVALKRIQASLDPPSTVSLSLDNDVIRASGSASHHWIEQARSLARLMPYGSPALDLSALKDVELTEFDSVRDAIQSRMIHFDFGVPIPAAGQDDVIDALAADLRQLTEVIRRLRLVARVTVIGHADSVGKDTPNLALSQGRAEVVRSLLLKREVAPDLLFVRAAGPLEPLQAEATEHDRSMNRRVSFSVGLIE